MKVKKFISLLTAMISFYNLGLSKNAEYLETHAVQLTKTSDKSDVSTGKELYDSLPKNNNPFYLNNHYTIKNDEDEPKLIIYGDLV